MSDEAVRGGANGIEGKMGERVSRFLKVMGPGMLFAGTAIGGSHLVQSTRAGADYGFMLAGVIILANLLKYPFFEFSNRYTAVTGRNMLEGYLGEGRWMVWLYLLLSVIVVFVNMAALAMVTGALVPQILGAEAWLPKEWAPMFWSSLVLLGSLLLLCLGRYPALDLVTKICVLLLAVSSLIALGAALSTSPIVPASGTSPHLWTLGGFSFLLALIGWMPAPLDVSVWPSIWARERARQTRYTPSAREARVEFDMGYIGTAILALVFLSLGALVLRGSGEPFAASSGAFSRQVVSLYTKTVGQWMFYVIATAAFMTMYSSALTVLDAYPRSLSIAMGLLFPAAARHERALYYAWLSLITAGALAIIWALTETLLRLVDIATIITFMTAPFLAYFNYRVVTASRFPEHARPPAWLRVLAIAGMLFLTGFSLVFIAWQVLRLFTP